MYTRTNHSKRGKVHKGRKGQKSDPQIVKQATVTFLGEIRKQLSTLSPKVSFFRLVIADNLIGIKAALWKFSNAKSTYGTPTITIMVDRNTTPPPPPYTPVIFDGTLPAPNGEIATELHKVAVDALKQQALEIYQFLRNENRESIKLNMDHTPRTCVIGLLQSSQVRIVHCLGVATF